MNRAGTILSLISATTLLLAGCSPHPATGTWVAGAESDAEFNRLEVTFEGRANLFKPDEKQAGRHCFWSGETRQVISMSCKPASNPDIEEHYRLEVGEDGIAVLLRNGKETARLSRQSG